MAEIIYISTYFCLKVSSDKMEGNQNVENSGTCLIIRIFCFNMVCTSIEDSDSKTCTILWKILFERKRHYYFQQSVFSEFH